MKRIMILFASFELIINLICIYIRLKGLIIVSLVVEPFLLAIFTPALMKHYKYLIFSNKTIFFLFSLIGIIVGYVIILIISIISNPNLYSISLQFSENLIVLIFLILKSLIVYIISYFVSYFIIRKKIN